MSLATLPESEWKRSSYGSLAILVGVSLASILLVGAKASALTVVVIPAVVSGMIGGGGIALAGQQTLVRRTVGLITVVIGLFAALGVLAPTATSDPRLVLLFVASLVTGYGLAAAGVGSLHLETLNRTTRRLFAVTVLGILAFVLAILVRHNGPETALTIVEVASGFVLEPGRQPSDPGAFVLILAITLRTVRALATRIDVSTLLTPASQEKYEPMLQKLSWVIQRSSLLFLYVGGVLVAISIWSTPAWLGQLPAVGPVLDPIVDLLYTVSRPSIMAALLTVLFLAGCGIAVHRLVGRFRGQSPRKLVRAIVPPAVTSGALVGILALGAGSAAPLLASVSGFPIVEQLTTLLGSVLFLQLLALASLLTYTVLLAFGVFFIERGALPRVATGSAIVSIGMFLACPAAVVVGDAGIVPFLAVAGMLTWDAGEHGTRLAAELHARATTLRLELVHLGLSATVGALFILVITGAGWLVTALHIDSSHAIAVLALVGASIAFLLYATTLWD